MPLVFDKIRLAFIFHVVEQILRADEALQSDERRYLDRLFPPGALRSVGFIDDHGNHTDTLHASVAEALETLPLRLSLEEKLELVDVFLEASLADGEFHHSEGDVMRKAAGLLGVTADEFIDHLDSSAAVGDVDLPEPE